MMQAQPGPSPDSPTAAVEGACPFCLVAFRAVYRGIEAEETGERFGVDACPKCGLGRTRPSPVDLAPYYGPSYYGKRHGPTARMCVRRRLGILRRRAGPGLGRALLDYGSGDGHFLGAARGRGWDVRGIERDRPRTSEGPGDPPVFDKLDDLAGGPPIACATFWHVLEHLDDPVGVLAGLRPMMADGGLVLAAVPDFGSRQSRVAGASWLHLDLPRHLWHFTPGSLTRAFEAAGFRPAIVPGGELEYDVVGWSQGLLNRFLGGRNEFFQAVSGRPGGAWSIRKASQVAAGLALSAVAAGPAWLEGRVGGGGTLIVAARADA